MATTLRSVLEAKIALIEDDLTKQIALLVLEDYLNARTAYANSAGEDNITAYSVQGRSFSFGGAEDLRKRYLELESELAEYIQGSVDQISMDTHEDDSS